MKYIKLSFTFVLIIPWVRNKRKYMLWLLMDLWHKNLLPTISIFRTLTWWLMNITCFSHYPIILRIAQWNFFRYYSNDICNNYKKPGWGIQWRLSQNLRHWHIKPQYSKWISRFIWIKRFVCAIYLANEDMYKGETWFLWLRIL